MPWILNEDAAIKAKLSDIEVSVNGAGLAVPVRFSMPEPEVVDMTYPIIIIERGTIAPAPERMHQGWVEYPFVEGKAVRPDDALWDYYGDWPIPHDVNYQISVLSRSRTHQSALIGALARGDRLPSRYGYLELPQVERIVPLALLHGPELVPAYDRKGKRLFTTHYLVQAQTEYTPWEVTRYEFVQHVRGTVTDVKTQKWDLATFDDQS